MAWSLSGNFKVLKIKKKKYSNWDDPLKYQ
jgi:hypothetical protein